jgi:hypothetical protein
LVQKYLPIEDHYNSLTMSQNLEHGMTAVHGRLDLIWKKKENKW